MNARGWQTRALPLFAIMALPTVATAQALVDPGFETSTPVLGLPNAAGVWGDDVVSFVGASQGITPRTGTRMARFDATSPAGASTLSGGELLQLVDIGASTALVQTGNAVATAEAWFERVAGGSTVDTQFWVTIRAYSGSVSSFATHFNHSELALVDGNLISDAVEGTWQRATARLCLPPTTSYLAIRITAIENVVNDATAPEFAGHFADDVALSIALDPLAINSFCVGAPNSVGSGASITAVGSTSRASNDFTLVASGTPPSVPGLFFYGRIQGEAPFGDGWRCITGTTFRLGPALVTSGGGSVQRRVDFTVPPASMGSSVILPHTSWSFQFWYRNVLGPGSTGFNLSNGVAATFAP